MIPERSGVTVQGTVEGHDIQMAIDESSLTHIMGILIDLYADPELALIREYSTNALDAHIQAGVSKPIEVITPTKLRPTLMIRDFGIGLDTEDIEKIYSRYGASTKRDSNDAVGMLGLGCKAALAYVDQFTLTGIKDGVRTVVVVSRDEDGKGTMTVLETTATDKGNGVEVSIPVNPHNEIAEKAKEFFSYWQPGTVMLDGKEPERINGYRLNDRMVVVNKAEENAYGYRRHYGYDNDNNAKIVMGNVAYGAQLDIRLPYGNVLVVTVPIGSVQFAPSREALQDTPRTQRVLDEIAAEFKREAEQAVQRDAAKAKTPQEAVKLAIKAGKALGIDLGQTEQAHNKMAKYPTSGARFSAISYKGKKIPNGYIFPEDKGAWSSELIDPRPNQRCYHNQNQSMGIEGIIDSFWVTNFQNKRVSAVMMRKLWAYCKAHGINTEDQRWAYWTYLSKPPLSPWSDKVTSVDWEVVKAWKDPSAPKTSRKGARSGSYLCCAPGKQNNETIVADAIDDTKPIVFTENHDGFGHGVKNNIESVLGEFTFVQLNVNRINKFKKMFPKAESTQEALNKAARVWWDDLSEDQRLALSYHGQECYGLYYRHLRKNACWHLDAKEVNDPDLATAARVATLLDTELGAAWNIWRNYLSVELDKIEALKGRYPLLFAAEIDAEDENMLSHLAIYANTVFDQLPEPVEQETGEQK